ncbi:MAG: ABC transporter substrate-binding protein [Maritimibacter sp.]|jgi:ABC-type nitrate/sulfonate/bicarbonate transport system substrate-binding protein|uniref:ABC transporter substrate-binding protein n=1 Tax=Maritimibacter sp. TaxID=2003363 RepID=UPI001D725C5A|nr:ABC transporter substrate-binding protein [Maritimibacter sp.]MBL6430252.1 ABC transporter substrate-binding protein [Maritimibacter sp.]
MTFAQKAGEPPVIRAIVFPGGFNWPIFAARRLGFFAAQGIEVTLEPTTDSKHQMAGLIDGEYDLAMTAIDNVYAYNAGQGEAPTRNVADLIAVMGADSGFLNLVGVPGTESIAGLAGRRVGVDALTTGYAFVLLRMLEQAGVGREDVDFVGSGGVMARFGALMNREFDATLLVSPFDAAATKQGFVHLGSGLEALGSYQGVVATVRRDWAAKNEAAVTGYIRAWRQAVAWLFDPANREAAIGLLLEEVPQMDPDVAAISYEVLLDPTTGFYSDGAINMDGARVALELRRAYGAPDARLGQVADHLDTRYHAASGGA